MSARTVGAPRRRSASHRPKPSMTRWRAPRFCSSTGTSCPSCSIELETIIEAQHASISLDAAPLNEIGARITGLGIRGIAVSAINIPRFLATVYSHGPTWADAH